MNKYKIKIPSTPLLYQYQVPVTIEHINYGSHLGHDRVLHFLHEARIRYLETLKVSELDFWGKGLILSQVGIQYFSEVFRGEELSVNLYGEVLSDVRFNFVYEVQKRGTDTCTHKAFTTMVSYDYDLKKTCKLPESFVLS